MAWRRARSRLRGVIVAWLAAWSRATRTVTVKEIRSGSLPACRAASAFRAHSAWQTVRNANSSWRTSSGERERRMNAAPRRRVFSSA